MHLSVTFLYFLISQYKGKKVTFSKKRHDSHMKLHALLPLKINPCICFVNLIKRTFFRCEQCKQKCVADVMNWKG